MKLLIIAGPYEADRVRRAVVQAGFEAVAVEPGESLSGWITASRPDLIVLAPQIVNPDPTVALAKVRAVPRGRVPTLLVGDPDDEPRLRDLADGFLPRPLSMSDLVTRVRARLGSGERRLSTGEHGVPAPMTDVSSGEFARPGTPGGASGAKAPGSGSGPRPATGSMSTPSSGSMPGASLSPASGSHPASSASSGSGATGPRPLPQLKPLVSAADATTSPVPRARPSEAGALFNKLAESIDAALDAEMLDFARSVGAIRKAPPAPAPPSLPPAIAPVAAPPSASRTGTALRPPEDLFERTPMAPMTALAAAAALPHVEDNTTTPSMPTPFDAPDVSDGDGGDVRDETRQKTVEVPRDVFAKMIAERIAVARDGGAQGQRDAGVPAPVESGKIADSDVAAQFGRLYLQRLTGRLVLRRDAIEKVIFFDRGAPILGMSSDPDDRMGEMLVRQGRLTQLQLVRASEGLSRAERRLGVVLVELGFIKPSELPVVVRRHFEEIIHSAFTWEDGEWSLGPGQPNQEIVLLDESPAAIILAGIRRKYSAARLSRCLGGGRQVFRLVDGAAGSELVQQMAMTPEERGIVLQLDGTRSLEQVRGEARTREEIVLGVAWALSVLGQIDRLESSLDVRADELVKAAAAVAGNGVVHEATLERARPPGPLRADRARVLAHHDVVEEGDYFAVLGLPRGASDVDVRAAHARLMRELTPTSLDPGLVAELGAELRAIRVVLDEALRVLGTPDLRRRYETNLPASAEHALG
jgi:hypothetical protein